MNKSIDEAGRSDNGFGIALKWRVLICCSLLAMLMSRMDPGKLAQAFRGASATVFMALVGTHILYHSLCGYRWYGLLCCVDKAIPLGRVLRISFISVFVGSMMPGTVGAEISRVVGVARSNTTVTKAVFSVALDRMLGTVTLSLMVLSGLVMGTAHLNEWVVGAAAFILVGVVLLTLIVTSKRARKAAFRMLPKRVSALIGGRLRKVTDCIDAYRGQPSAVAKALLLSFGAQIIRVVNVWLAGRALGLELPIAYLMVTVPIVIFLLMLPISIGGLGVRETGYIYLLGLIGISSESAFAVSLLLYLALLTSTLPGGVLLLLSRARRAEGGLKVGAAGIVAVAPSPSVALGIEKGKDERTLQS
jgi:glycosyltransferase 2 family protein